MQNLKSAGIKLASAIVLAVALICCNWGGVRAQTLSVSGIVTDETGEPLIGATVQEKGTSNGTATDADGAYSIKTAQGKTLVFSYIGYITKEVQVNGAKINVTMKENTNALEEVVVVGYGSMTRKDVTSSITTVRAKDMNVGIYTDPAQMLQGKVAGLSIVQSSDPNGGTASITLRGASTLNGSTSPLYVIDGIPDADLSLVSPNDIESIDVLRDASATAIYGSKAANGVIIVTTKRGTEGRTNVTYSGYVSWERSLKNLEMMNASELRAFAESGGWTIINDNGQDTDTDWQDEVLRTGFAQNHNLSITGGNDKTRYAASVNYMKRDGIVRGTNMDRLIGRSLVEASMLKDHLTVTLQVNGSISNHQGVPMNQKGASALDAMYYFSPLNPVRNEDGTWYEGSYTSQNYNPLSLINENVSKSQSKRIDFTGKASLKIIDGLFLNANFNYLNHQWDYKDYYSTQTQTPDEKARHGQTSRNTTESVHKLMEIYGNYDKTFNNVHKLGIMAGYSWEQWDTGEGFGARAYNFFNDDLGWDNIGLGNSYEDDPIWGNVKLTRRMISFYGRANYSYDGKYLLQAAIRRDGSSSFGSNNEWATFPSASAAWRISQEDFIKNLGIFDDLKVRVGWGQSGNSTGFDALTSRFYYFWNTWDKIRFDYNGTSYKVLTAARNENKDLKWETTTMLNIGLDFAFFNGRLNGTIEYYNKDTKDMIFEYSVPSTVYPVDKMTANVGKMNNRGVEVTINAVPVQNRDLTWTTTLNLTHNRNKVVSLSKGAFTVNYIDKLNPDLAGYDTWNVQRIMEGEPVGTFYMWEWAGYDDQDRSVFYKHDPETGDRLVDENGNYVTTDSPNNDDRVKKGSAQPKQQLGWNNELRYKNWTLNAFFQGTFGNKIFNGTRAYYSNVTNVGVGKNVLKDCAKEQRVNDTRAQAPSDRYLEDGDYFRLSSLTLGYTFRNCFNGWLSNVHVYGTVNNVFTLTKYKGIDPEINLGGLEPGWDARINRYPRTRQFIVGVNVNF